ncbi:MAG: serine protein kinase PrkA [Deltaproteobacteria bacterium]|jgi:predicted Ser/Thr protein kinase|nr:serine protein kinase PrkA [Deltaproteobacteria bacterium]MBW2535260.1 serine protein kinase PrkA [Deltaproteobacteria bacterium]
MDSVRDRYAQSRRVLSFQEYLELFAGDPGRFGRNAAHYVRDMFEFFGSVTVERPWGSMTRFRLFDAPWQAADLPGQEPRLVGHEKLQAEIHRALSNFSREGRANRLVLMHGPNGSAKTTVASCILRALEHYSAQDEGALYRFHWIFPKRVKGRGTIGFGGSSPAREPDSYAHLDEDAVDARLIIELRDHPLFLLPRSERRPLLDQLYGDAGLDGPPEWLISGQLCHKNKQIFEALLATYDGALVDVLRHVQVERYFLSRRYRVGAVTVGPQMTVDAGERQITADRSVAALPTFLQATTLFEAFGDLVDAAGGVLEFSDLLKRPIDVFRYLQQTLETGSVSLQQQTLFTNVVMIGSANEIHLAAFRGHPEWGSFRGRLELVRAHYLLSYLDEQAIYDQQIAPQVRRHVAPHATRVAAEFVALTRLRRPSAERLEGEIGEIAEGLSAVEKMELYGSGEAPSRLSRDQRKLLKANIQAVYEETADELEYEGLIGASPREGRTVLLDAAQSEEFSCLSPFAVLTELDRLCKRSAEFEWLKLETQEGGYHDSKSFRAAVRERLLDRVEADLTGASGLIEDMQYGELFGRYIQHVSVWVKGEKIKNPVTGADEDPDERLMKEVEGLLGIEGDRDEHRRGTISMIAAWAIDHPDESPTLSAVFPSHVERLQKAAFARLRKQFALLLRDVVTLLRDQGKGLSEEERRKARAVVDRTLDQGYCERCALDAVSRLLGERLRELIT